MKQVSIQPEGINIQDQQRDLFDKLYSELIEVNVSEVCVNVAMGAAFTDLAEYVMYPRSDEERSQIQAQPREKYQIGVLSGINVFVDPMMSWMDTRVLGEGIEITVNIDPSMIV